MITPGKTFQRARNATDLILDLAGNHPFSACKRVLTPNGIHVGAGMLAGSKSLVAMLLGLIVALLLSGISRQKFVVFMAKVNHEDLTYIGELLAGGKLKPVIDRTYTLNEVPDAIRYQGTWRVRGKLVIDLDA